MSEKADLWREAQEGYEAAAGALYRNLHRVSADISAPPYVHTFAPSREYMTASEIAAQISAEHDVHVDCVHAVLNQLADWWDTDVDHLVRFDEPPPFTITIGNSETGLEEKP